MINLKLVDESSFQAVLDLKISDADERARFVASNVRSLADAWLYRENGDVFPMAIYWHEQVLIKEAQMDRGCNHIIADYVVGNEKMKYLLTSLGFQETGFIEENNEVAMRLDLKKEE